MREGADSPLGRVDAVLAAFGGATTLPASRALAAVGGDEAALVQCLVFLRERDLLLFAIGDERLFHRPSVCDEVLALVAVRRTVSPEDVVRHLGLPAAIVGQALGWLERDGQVEVDAVDGAVVVRRR